MGDGVLAYFGYPRADEHDAERAVRAGLALIGEVARLDTAAGVPLQVRVGNFSATAGFDRFSGPITRAVFGMYPALIAAWTAFRSLRYSSTNLAWIELKKGPRRR
jgi:hypothetical protein